MEEQKNQKTGSFTAGFALGILSTLAVVLLNKDIRQKSIKKAGEIKKSLNNWSERNLDYGEKPNDKKIDSAAEELKKATEEVKKEK